MTIWNATMPIWIGVVVAIAVAPFVGALIYGWYQAEQECKKTRVAYWNERDGKIQAEEKLLTVQAQHDTLKTENTSLDEDNACMAEANAGIAKERNEWMALYNELLKTYHDLQGDAHATAPLQDAAPVKRTRKKAGAQ